MLFANFGSFEASEVCLTLFLLLDGLELDFHTSVSMFAIRITK
jgi:hypothetical protein